MHFLAPFEPMEDWGERQLENEEEEDRGEGNDRMAERPEEQPGMSVEVQIGRKLREIGDKFNQDHVELVSLTPEQIDLLHSLYLKPNFRVSPHV